MEGIRLDCGHDAIDRERTRAYHGANELWCPFCQRWSAFVIAEQGALFEETVGEREEAERREENGQPT